MMVYINPHQTANLIVQHIMSDACLNHVSQFIKDNGPETKAQHKQELTIEILDILKLEDESE